MSIINLKARARMSSKLTLDIACGNQPRGHINIDKNWTKNTDSKHVPDPMGSPNFIIADAQYLPIRSKSIQITKMFWGIEHVPNVGICLTDIARVTIDKAIITTDNLLAHEPRTHFYSFGKVTFENILRPFFKNVKVTEFSQHIVSSILFKMSKNFPTVLRRPFHRWVYRTAKLDLLAVCEP